MASRSQIGGGTTVPVSDDEAPIRVFSRTVQHQPAPTANLGTVDSMIPKQEREVILDSRINSFRMRKIEDRRNGS
jgi:hypothetical protein